MKYRLVFLCLALALLLTGCGLVTDQYHSVHDHVDSYTKPAEEITVNSYEELVDTLLALINEGAETATLTTDVYSGDIEEDFSRAVDSILRENANEAYLVSEINREIVSVGSYYRVDLAIRYRHQIEDLKNIEENVFMHMVQGLVEAALNGSEETLLMHVLDYEDIDFRTMVKEYVENNLTEVIAEPYNIWVQTYPGEGGDRILELRFFYRLEHNALSSRKQFVDYMIDSAKDSVIGEPSDLVRAKQLYVNQIGGHSYTEESAETPAFALFIDRKGDSKVFSAVYEAMCKKSEVNCTTVHGTRNGKPYDWNILELEAGVWHVDVNADAQAGAPELRFLTDAEMEGYEWDAEAYPACVGYFEPVAPPQEETTEAENPEQPEEPEPQPEPEPNPEPTEENPAEPENSP